MKIKATAFAVVALLGLLVGANNAVGAPQPASAALASSAASPPTGFAPETAGPSELEKYGLPQRPRDSAGLGHWRSLVEHAKSRVPVHFSDRAHATVTGNTSSNWAGNYDTGKTFNSVGAVWTVPSIPTTSPRYSSTWVGLGLGTSLGNPLIQAGNDQTATSGSRSYGLWYEIYTPSTNQEKYTGWSVAAGNQVEIDIDVSGRTASFFIENITTSHYQSFPVAYASAITGCACNTADYIEENQGPNPGTAHNLAAFGSVRLTGAYNYDSGNVFHHVGDLNHTYLNMVDNLGKVAYPGSIASNNADFTIYRTSTA